MAFSMLDLIPEANGNPANASANPVPITPTFKSSPPIKTPFITPNHHKQEHSNTNKIINNMIAF